MIVPAAAPVIIPECRHTGVAVPRVCGAPRPIGWLPPLTPGLLAKPQPLPLPSFPPLAPPRGARLAGLGRRAPRGGASGGKDGRGGGCGFASRRGVSGG